MAQNDKIYYKTIGFSYLAISFYVFHKLSTEIWSVLFIISICVLTDIGGYTFGKLIGGPKLTKISPNKTYAGVFGGYLLSSMFLIFFLGYLEQPQISQIEYIVFIIFLSTVSQFGDLIISYFKRQAKVKNTGNIIPGHGGLLDRIDGMIFTFPIFYIIKLFYFYKI